MKITKRLLPQVSLETVLFNAAKNQPSVYGTKIKIQLGVRDHCKVEVFMGEERETREREIDR
jgi:hypothetical protein